MSPGGNRAKQRKMICEKGVTLVNCPVCGKEMTSGFLNTYGMWNYFLPQGAPKLRWLTTGGIEQMGGIVLKDPYTSLKDAGALDRPAWVCRSCKKIVMEYW